MPSFNLESVSSRKNLIMIGVDEAGRGSWAGPLVAASCWIDFQHRHLPNSGINDSKKLTHSKRKQILTLLAILLNILQAFQQKGKLIIMGLLLLMS